MTYGLDVCLCVCVLCFLLHMLLHSARWHNSRCFQLQSDDVKNELFRKTDAVWTELILSAFVCVYTHRGIPYTPTTHTYTGWYPKGHDDWWGGRVAVGISTFGLSQYWRHAHCILKYTQRPTEIRYLPDTMISPNADNIYSAQRRCTGVSIVPHGVPQ